MATGHDSDTRNGRRAVELLAEIWPKLETTGDWMTEGTYGRRGADGSVHSHLCRRHQGPLYAPAHDPDDAHDDAHPAVGAQELLGAHLDTGGCGCLGELDSVFHLFRDRGRVPTWDLHDNLSTVIGAVLGRVQAEAMEDTVNNMDLSAAEHNDTQDDELVAIAAAAFRMQVNTHEHHDTTNHRDPVTEALRPFINDTTRLLSDLTDHIRRARHWGHAKLARALMTPGGLPAGLPVLDGFTKYELAHLNEPTGTNRWEWDAYAPSEHGSGDHNVHAKKMRRRHILGLLTEHPALASNQLWTPTEPGTSVVQLITSTPVPTGTGVGPRPVAKLRCAACAITSVNGTVVVHGPALAFAQPKRFTNLGTAADPDNWLNGLDLHLALHGAGTPASELGDLVAAIDH